MKTKQPVIVVRKPVEVNCVKCKGGVMFRVQLSRLEEGLGHEGFKCDKCGHSVKHVPVSR